MDKDRGPDWPSKDNKVIEKAQACDRMRRGEVSEQGDLLFETDCRLYDTRFKVHQGLQFLFCFAWLAAAC